MSDLRKKEKEITDRKELEEILQKAEICRIALVDGDTPYIVPVNYGYKDNKIYFIRPSREGSWT